MDAGGSEFLICSKEGFGGVEVGVSYLALFP